MTISNYNISDENLSENKLSIDHFSNQLKNMKQENINDKVYNNPTHTSGNVKVEDSGTREYQEHDQDLSDDDQMVSVFRYYMCYQNYFIF